MAKSRELIDIVKKKKRYIEYYDQWVDLTTYREFSTFPSENDRFWPDRKQMHNTTAVWYKEWITYDPIYIGVKLAGFSTTPDQYLLPDQDFRNMMNSMAMNKAMAKFMSGKQQLGADFGERKKTIDMITKRVRQAYDVLRFVKKGNLYAAVRTLKGGRKPVSKRIAELRLEFVYGWAPLVGSIYDIAQKEFPPWPELYISEAVSKPFMKQRGNMSTDGRVRAVYSMLLVMDSPTVASAEKLGLTNPASIAWELVPFSFIVDWFIPISTYLQSLTAFSGFTIKDKCLSYKEDLYCSNIDKLGFGRTRLFSNRIRNIHIEPGYRALPKNPLSITHALNALALIRVLRK